MLVSYYLPGNSLAPPSGLRARGDSAHTEEEQSLFDPFPYGWSAGGGFRHLVIAAQYTNSAWGVTGLRHR